MKNNHDKLIGGTRARLAKMRRYRDDWNAKADSGARKYCARRRLLDGLAGCLQARGHGVGQWSGSACGIGKIDTKKDSVCAGGELVAGWRDRGAAHGINSRLPLGWYADSDGRETYAGHVWQLPARDGAPQYVAGYVESETDAGYVVLDCTRGALTIFDDEKEAARAGDGLAESAAEEAREYDERWQEASRAEGEREQARDTIKQSCKDARAQCDALRELKTVNKQNGRAWSAIAGLLRETRAEIHAALVVIRKAGDKIEALGMSGEF